LIETLGDRKRVRALGPVSLSVALVVWAALIHGCGTTPGMHETSSIDAGLSARDAQPGKWRIRLFWRTETELNSFGYYVYRCSSSEAEPVCLNQDRPLFGAGSTTIPQEYVFYDLDVAEGQTWHYKLEQVDLDGTRRWLVGHPAPVPGKPQPLTEDEVDAIHAFGTMYRQEAGW